MNPKPRELHATSRWRNIHFFPATDVELSTAAYVLPGPLFTVEVVKTMIFTQKSGNLGSFPYFSTQLAVGRPFMVLAGLC